MFAQPCSDGRRDKQVGVTVHAGGCVVSTGLLIETLLERPLFSLNFIEVDDTMVRDPNSQSELFPGLARGSIRRTIYRVTRNLDVVDEIEQEVSVIWYHNRWRWPFIRNQQQYVERIAIREAAKHVNRENEKRERFDASVEKEQALDPPLLRQEAPDTAEVVFLRSTLDAFKASLPPHLASVLDLHRQGYKTEEIATVRGIRPYTAKGYLADIATHAQDFFNK